MLTEPVGLLLGGLGVTPEPCTGGAALLYPFAELDPVTAARLARISYEALRSLDRAECLATLAGLGTSRYRLRIEAALTQMLRLASQPRR